MLLAADDADKNADGNLHVFMIVQGGIAVSRREPYGYKINRLLIQPQMRRQAKEPNALKKDSKIACVAKNETSGGDDSRVSRRGFLGAAALAGVGASLTMGASRAIASMAPYTGGAIAFTPTLRMPETGVLKILQITDSHIHFIASGYLLDQRLTDNIASMVEIFKPDLIMHTGDFWASMSGTGKEDTCRMVCKEFVKFATPWAFAWGNHDESRDYNKAHATLEKAPYSLYSGSASDGNYRIAVRPAPDAPPVWNLIALNNSRGGFMPEQLDWFKREADAIRKETPEPPPAILFFHIPLPQYRDAADSGAAKGVMFEPVSDEKAPRDAFKVFKEAGFVKAMYCGHDHVNDWAGTLDGISLNYGRALGGYGADKVRKGGTLITLEATGGKFDSITVFPDGTSVKYDKLIKELEPGRLY